MPTAFENRNRSTIRVYFPDHAKTENVRLPGGVSLPAGSPIGYVNTPQQNEVQTVTITGTPTGGTFTLTAPGVGTTAAIAYNAAAAAVQTALNDLLGAGAVVVTGGPGPGTPYVLTFSGLEWANTDVALFTATGSFTGGSSPAVAVAETTKGGSGLALQAALADGSTVTAKCVLLQDTQTDAKGAILNEFGSANQFGAGVLLKGTVAAADIPGLTSTIAGQLGKILTGNAVTDAGALIEIGV